MNEEHKEKEPSVFGTILGAAWGYEKSLWRWAAAAGLMGAVVAALVGGFFGYASYGYAGMIGATILGAMLGWVVTTLVFYVLLSTASFFS